MFGINKGVEDFFKKFTNHTSVAMKSILFLIFVFCSVRFSEAQSLSPEVISPAGNCFVNGTKQIDWTLGQTATFTLSDGTHILTQGFHQHNLTVTTVDNFDSNYEFNIFPNPTADIIQIQSQKAHNENYTIELYTLEGKLLTSKSSDHNTLSQIDMENYDNGTYLLKIKNKDSALKTYQIVKLK